MEKILLILSTMRSSSKAIEMSLAIAGENNAKLLILFILDDQMTHDIINTLSAKGWIGGRPSEQLIESILGGYETLGKTTLKEITQMAESKAIPFSTMIKSGDFIKISLDMINQERIDFAVVTRRKRSALSRFLFGSAVAELKEKSVCQLKIVDEE